MLLAYQGTLGFLCAARPLYCIQIPAMTSCQSLALSGTVVACAEPSKLPMFRYNPSPVLEFPNQSSLVLATWVQAETHIRRTLRQSTMASPQRSKCIVALTHLSHGAAKCFVSRHIAPSRLAGLTRAVLMSGAVSMLCGGLPGMRCAERVCTVQSCGGFLRM